MVSEGEGTPRHLVQLGEDLRALLAEQTQLALEGQSRRVTLLAENDPATRDAVEIWADDTRSRVRNARQGAGVDLSGRATTLDARAWSREVRMEQVHTEVAIAQAPLLPLICLYNARLVIAPVRVSVLMFDDVRLCFLGPEVDSGATSMWGTTDRELVAAAVELHEAQLAHGRDIPIPPVTPSNERRLWVLIHLLNGLTDEAIARRLGASPRAVARDVQALKDMAGVTNRIDLVWAVGYGGLE